MTHKVEVGYEQGDQKFRVKSRPMSLKSRPMSLKSRLNCQCSFRRKLKDFYYFKKTDQQFRPQSLKSCPNSKKSPNLVTLAHEKPRVRQIETCLCNIEQRLSLFFSHFLLKTSMAPV